MQDKHLVFLIHGLGGYPGHLKAIESALGAQFGDKVVAYVATSNAGFRTLEGAVLGADRLCHELLALLIKLAKEGVRIVRLSFVGYSFGGIWSRYLIGMLEELGIWDSIEPYMFTTFATPHMGSKLPKGSVTSLVANAIGSHILGTTGHDLFWKNGVMFDLADPNQIYFRGLKRFKHLQLFANATFDRTVPFWTSFLTAKNPFHLRNHLELKYYDHMHGQDYDALDAARVPFLVDMEHSRYSDMPTNDFVGLSPTEKRQRLFIFLLPIFVPVLLSLLTVGTVVAKVRSSWHPRHEHAAQWQEVQSACEDDVSAGPQKVGKKVDADLAELTGEMLEHVAVSGQGNRGYGNGAISPQQITQGFASPMIGVGNLEEQVPWELELEAPVKAAMANLNSLQWHKYVVKLRHFNAHAEIVDRRRSKGQGAELAKFYARLLARTLKEDQEASSSEANGTTGASSVSSLSTVK